MIKQMETATWDLGKWPQVPGIVETNATTTAQAAEAKGRLFASQPTLVKLDPAREACDKLAKELEAVNLRVTKHQPR